MNFYMRIEYTYLERGISNMLKSEEDRIIKKIKAYFKGAGRAAAIIGVSGGIDSALICYLTAKALGAENVFAYYLPANPNPQDERDVEKIVKITGVNYQKFDIRRAADTLAETVKPYSRISTGNIRVRARMLALYTFAHTHNGLVVGTGNRTELLLGYFTKYGDGGCDILPIGKLYKTQVWELAKIIGLPKEIIEKSPSAGMWEGQKDEKEIGMTYGEMDAILIKHFEEKKSWKELEKLIDKKKVGRIRELHEKSEHKRNLPPIL
jgi:NAD+ synthase